jgi:hypothetical protein
MKPPPNTKQVQTVNVKSLPFPKNLRTPKADKKLKNHPNKPPKLNRFRP